MTFLSSSNNNSSHSTRNYHRYLTRRMGQAHLPVYFFKDISNILYSGQEYLVKVGLATEESRQAQRVHVRNLVGFACRGRALADGYACAGGNQSSENFAPRDKLRAIYKSVGVRFDYRENVCSGTERSVDVAIQLQMSRLAVQTMIKNVRPGVVVLATGDGNRKEFDTFLDQLKDLKAAGHHIELLSWKDALHKGMENWVWQNDGDVILLDHHWDCLTFEEGGRRAKPLPAWISGPNRRSA